MENILQKLTGVFARKKQGSVLGIDISSSSLKVVQLRKSRGKAILETYGELSLGPYTGQEKGSATNLPAEKIAEALVDLLKEARTTTKDCGIAMPLNASLVTLMEMPDLPPAQLEKMIPIEVRKYIPVNISEVALDWWIIPKDENRYDDEPEKEIPEKGKKVDVLVVAVHQEVISKYQEIVKKAGLNAGFFEVELFSTIRAVVEQENAPVMVLDMGAAITKLYIIEHRMVKSSHVIGKGAQDVTVALSRSLGITIPKAEELKRSVGLSPLPENRNVSETISLVLGDIFSEANRILLSYQKKYNKNVSKVILTGGGVVLSGLADIAASAFEMQVVVGDPFSKVETPAFLQEVLRNAGAEFAVALGIALRKLDDVA